MNNRVSRQAATNAAETLGLDLDTATVEQVAVAYRYAAQDAHPDKGGSSEAFMRVKRAEDTLKQYLKNPPKDRIPEADCTEDCMRCSGKGFIIQQRGWRSMRVQCPDCRGRGYTVTGEMK